MYLENFLCDIAARNASRLCLVYQSQMHNVQGIVKKQEQSGSVV